MTQSPNTPKVLTAAITSNQRQQPWTVWAVALLINLLLVFGFAVPGGAQVEIVHDFFGTGDNPQAPLIQASDGFLYGTTPQGGTNNQGTVFKIANDGTGFAVLKSFQCGVATNGCNPQAGLIQLSDGFLYGTTTQGGANNQGTVFKIAADGTGFLVLKSFQCGVATNGCAPLAGLIQASDGFLYGATNAGGANNSGTLFKIAAEGTGFSLLKSFRCGVATNGCNSNAGLIQASDGFLYGTTVACGASDQGIVFKIATDGTGFLVLKSFQCSVATNGCFPLAGVIHANDGYLYGTAHQGGGGNNQGTVFKIAKNGTGFAVLKSLACITDGCSPQAGLLQLSDGYLYGTTYQGGGGNNRGTVFKVAPDGTGFLVIDSFACDGDDGCNPQAGLILANTGYLYGTTFSGGQYGAGTIFRFLPDMVAPDTTITSNPQALSNSTTDSVGNLDPSPASLSWTILTDESPPETTITSYPSSPTNRTNATFTFISSEAGSTFVCSIDGNNFTTCTSGVNYTGLANGSHNFQVKATDAAGNTDSTPEIFNWTVDSTIVTVLEGTVRDRNTGVPLAGVAVTSCGGTFTDANGNYSLTMQQLCNRASGGVSFRKTGYFQSNASYTIAATPTILNATLLPGGTLLQGIVTDASTHVAISGATVSISCPSTGSSSCDPGFDSSTGSDGRYEFDSSQFSESFFTKFLTTGFDIYVVAATAAGYFNYVIHGTPPNPLFTVSPPFPGTYNFEMIQTAGIVLRGTVTDRNTGTPLVGVSVNENTSCGSTVTDANGNYSLTAQQLCNRASGSVYFRKTGYFQSNASYTIAATPTILNATLLPGGTLLQGIVTDASTHVAISGATVSISCPSTGSSSCDPGFDSSTGSDGRYEFDSSQFSESFFTKFLTTGFDIYVVAATAAGYFNYVIHGTPPNPLFTVSPPFPGTYNFEMIQTAGIVLRGTVTDRNTGTPLVGVSVNENTSCGSTVTDANGNYSLTAQQLCNRASGSVYFRKTEYFQSNASYTIAATPTILNATLLPGGTLLQGIVTDASTHVAISGATVGISCPRSGTLHCDLTFDSSTGPDGRYEFDSSQFNEAFFTNLAAGFGVDVVTATAAGYFNYLVLGTLPNPLFTVSPPFPGTYNFAMSSTGVTRRITIATDPPGLNISVDGTSLVAPQQYDWTPSNAHTIATTTPQTPIAGTQYVFTGWSDGGAMSHTIVVPDSNAVYTATFARQYQLATSASPSSGGSVTAGGPFNSGASVSITATPASGFRFTGFSGDLSGTTNPQTVVMNGPRNVTANFTLNVLQTPVINWNNPADITFGAALSATQLNATASFNSTNVTGTFTYTPASGTKLSAENGQTLHVNFVPTDTASYTNASKDVLINVLKATPAVSVAGGTFPFDGNLHGATGFAYGVGGLSDVLSPAATFSYQGTGSTSYGPTATAPTIGGTFTATANFAGNANYLNASNSTALEITGVGISVSPASMAAGGTVTATWSNIPNPSPTDWIGLYRVGQPNTSHLDWIYVSCAKGAGIARVSGSCPFVLPSSLTAGNYELRLLANNGYVSLASTNLTIQNLPVVTIVATDAIATESLAGDNGVFTVSRTGGSIASSLPVNYTVGGSATNGTDYMMLGGSVIIQSGQPSASIVVTPIVDVTPEGSETVIVTLSSDAAYLVGSPASATVSIIDNPGPSQVVLSVIPLSTPPGATVTVTWSGIVNSSATDWIGLYAPGAPSTSHLEWIYVSCSKSAGSAVASGSCNFGIPAGLVNGTYQLRLLSNNGYTSIATSNALTVGGPPLPVVSITATANAAEPATSGQFTVSRTGSPINPLTVNYTVGGTAQPGNDYASIGSSVVIPANSTTATIPVNVSDDNVFEGSETVIVTLSSNANYVVGNPNTATVTIADDEPPPAGPAITVAPSTIARGSNVTATWSGIAASSATDWIGLYTVGSPNSPFWAWEYVSCTTSATTPRASGSCSFLIPTNAPAGSFELRLFSNNGFTRLATSNLFALQ